MKKDSNENIQDKLIEKTESRAYIEHPDCKRVVQGKKALLSKKTEKTYKVTVTYIKLTNEEAEIKRAIIERIVKKGYQSKDG